MGRITQRVDPGALADELERRGRAAVAFATAGRIDALPARVLRHGELFVGLDPTALPADANVRRTTLILDDGSFWFELRAVNSRGHMTPAQALPPGAVDDLAWFVFRPERETAWDYGTLHEEPEG